ncbi:hypothetical protein H5410_058332 [Solanum commersonii]|uniref:Uncharacterized protein n=1 Tax=Solanum commersonii TaxID=4109 RepID=A0A9J5WTC2_SOLCO|nr:hypothetical protein H5410_058332 [Solanum commersonii]
MLKWMRGHSKRDRNKNDDSKNKVGITFMVDKTREVSLRRVEHVKRRCTHSLIRRSERLNIVEITRGRSKPKKYGEVIRQDMTHLQLTENMTLDRKI